MSNNRIEMAVSTDTDLVDVLADVDVDIATGEPVDVVDAVYYAVLKKLSGKHNLKPGHYNVRLMCVVTDNEDGTQGT